MKFNKDKLYLKYTIPIILILIAVMCSTYFRMQPASLDITDEWAQNNVYNYYKSGIRNEIKGQYPYLDTKTTEEKVNEKFEEFKSNNEEQIENDKSVLSKTFRSKLQYDYNGKSYTYLLAIDPYLWYGMGKNYLDHGTLGTDGEMHMLRNGRMGTVSKFNLHPVFGVWLYKLLSLFSNIPLMYAFFLLPVILIGLSIIPAFFIGKKLTNNMGGFFAAMFVALNGVLLSRTSGGFADTDSYTVLFPLLITWMIMEAFEADKLKNKLIFGAVAGLFTGMFANIWPGWWYIFDFIILTMAINLVYKWLIYRRITENIKYTLMMAYSFIMSSFIFVTLLDSFKVFLSFFKGPLAVITLKDVGGVSLWPNVITTVAEFNTIKILNIIIHMGGPILFLIGLIGVVLLLFRKEDNKIDIKYFTLLLIWIIAGIYGFSKGLRFSILVVPPFAIAFGSGVSLLYKYIIKGFDKFLYLKSRIVNYVFIIIFALLFVGMLIGAKEISKREIPSMNDDWMYSLDSIKMASDDGIITSWWDFGHWFVAAGDRRVTFDGGDQSKRIHWVGKTLLTDNETEAINILRMLNCYQEELEELNTEECGNPLCGYKKTIEQLPDISCEYIPQYFIVSEDMIGKAGVWAHFGSWDFDRASLYYKYKNGYLDSGISQKDYYDIQAIPADKWISPHPSFIGSGSCNKENNVTNCVVNTFNKQTIFLISETEHEYKIRTNDGLIPINSVIYLEDVVIVKEYDGKTTGVSVIETDNGILLASEEVAESLFTKLFFFKGAGLDNFELISSVKQLDGQMIYAYKVNLE